jgi:hypothetical protein
MIRVKENSVSPGKNRDYPERKYRFPFLILYGYVCPGSLFFSGREDCSPRRGFESSPHTVRKI